MKKLLFIALLFAVSCGGGTVDVTKPAEKDEAGFYRNNFQTDYKERTSKGALVVSGKSIDPAILPMIDAQLDKLFDVARSYGYQDNTTPGDNHFMLHASYRIALFDRSPRCENPAFVVDASGSPYEGTEWDKDPSPSRALICAAGMMFRDNIPPGGVNYYKGTPGLLVTVDGIKTSEIVRYEGEHNVLLEADQEKFAQTQYHTGSGGGHPILPEKNEPRALVSQPGQPNPLKVGDSYVWVTK
jgi:hypothetical protein